MRKFGEETLASACRMAALAQVEADSSLLIAKAARVCDRVADECGRWQADLVVVGTEGRHGLDRFLMGSDAEQIVRHAPVPVLVVRTAESA
jgi:nucleotide-binding universal stress UspA family protein